MTHTDMLVVLQTKTKSLKRFDGGKLINDLLAIAQIRPRIIDFKGIIFFHSAFYNIC